LIEDRQHPVLPHPSQRDAGSTLNRYHFFEWALLVENSFRVALHNAWPESGCNGRLGGKTGVLVCCLVCGLGPILKSENPPERMLSIRPLLQSLTAHEVFVGIKFSGGTFGLPIEISAKVSHRAPPSARVRKCCRASNC